MDLYYPIRRLRSNPIDRAASTCSVREAGNFLDRHRAVAFPGQEQPGRVNAVFVTGVHDHIEMTIAIQIPGPQQRPGSVVVLIATVHGLNPFTINQIHAKTVSHCHMSELHRSTVPAHRQVLSKATQIAREGGTPDRGRL